MVLADSTVVRIIYTASLPSDYKYYVGNHLSACLLKHNMLPWITALTDGPTINVEKFGFNVLVALVKKAKKTTKIGQAQIYFEALMYEQHRNIYK